MFDHNYCVVTGLQPQGKCHVLDFVDRLASKTRLKVSQA